MRRFRLLQLLCAVSLLLLSACGNKGPVRPLLVPQPQTVQAPELRQQGDALLLGWQLPTSNNDGSLLQHPPQVEIYRMSYDPANDCPECFERSTLLASIDPELPAPALKVDQRYLFYDRPLQSGSGYQYKLLVRSGDSLSRPLLLRQVYLAPVPAPTSLSATPRDRAILLQWQAPVLEAGDQLLGYLVYRQAGGSDSPYPLTGQPLSQPRFEDFSLDNGTSYRYRVSALVKRGEQRLEGLASAAVEATPQAGI